MIILDFIPSTLVNLLVGVPFDNTYKDTITFANVGAQTAYFASKKKHTFSDFSYQRVNHTLRVPVVADLCYDCNYIMFQNANFGTKWFYAFITGVNYISQTASEISYEIDVMQTWYFNYTLQPSFVDREHVSDDSLFANLLPESLEYGDNIVSSTGMYDLSDMAIVLIFVPLPSDTSGGQMIDGVFSGLKYLWFGTTDSEVAALNSMLQSFANAGLLDNIVAVIMLPWQFVIGGAAGITLNSDFTTIDGYTPKNKKLFMYPYKYCAINNCAGNEALYKYEYFANPSAIHWTIDYNYNIASTANCHPDNYKGYALNWDEGVILGNFPVCAWVGNAFSNWYALNRMTLSQNNMAAGMTAIMGVIGGAAVGGLAGAILGGSAGIVGGINEVASQMAMVAQKQLHPLQIEGQIKCDVANVKWRRVGFNMKCYEIKASFAKKIDDYFSMYGYKVNSVKVPNRTGRASWNFVKTIDVSITGSVPVDDIARIKSAYDAGLTFWHGDYVGDYTRDNSIV